MQIRKNKFSVNFLVWHQKLIQLVDLARIVFAFSNLRKFTCTHEF